MDKLMLRDREVAEALGICRSMASKLIVGGQIPSVKLGRSRRVPVVLFQKWLAERAAEAEANAAEAHQHKGGPHVR